MKNFQPIGGQKNFSGEKTNLKNGRYIINSMTEEWKICFENYEISNFGNCRRHGSEIKGCIQNRGYKYFQIQRDGKRINKLFHHLVAEQFIGERPDGLVIDHIDRNKLNNNVNNLRYISHTENLQNTDKYRSDILETDKRLRYNLLKKEYYRRDLAKEGKEIKYTERGSGSIKQKPNGRWKVQFGLNKKNYIKTFDTEDECKNFVTTIQNNYL